MTHSFDPWRGDCERNPVSPQSGTWKYDRNGWCPGTIVVGDRVDVTAAVVPGVANVFDFDIRLPDGSEYHNTKAIDLPPYEIVSTVLLVYE